MNDRTNQKWKDTAAGKDKQPQMNGKPSQAAGLHLQAMTKQFEMFLENAAGSWSELLHTELRIALQQENLTLKNALESQSAETEKARTTAATHLSDLEKERKVLASLHEDVAVLHQKLEHLGHNHRNLQKSAGNVVANLSRRIHYLLVSLRSAKSQQISINSLHSEIKSLTESLEHEKQSHQDSVKDLEAKNCGLQQSLDDEKRAHEECVKVLKLKCSHEDKVKVNEELICRLQAEKEGLRASLGEKSICITSKKEELDNLQAVNRDLQQSLSQAQGERDEYKQEAESRRQELEKLHSQTENEINRHKSDTESTKSHLEGLLSKTLDDFNKYKADAQAAKGSLEESRLRMQRELNEHKQEAELQKTHMKDLRSGMMTTRIALEKKVEQSQTEANNAKADIENIGKENENLHIQLREVKNQGINLEKAVQKFTNIYDALITQHRKISLEHEDLIQEHQLLQNAESKLLQCKSGNHTEQGRRKTCMYKLELLDQLAKFEDYNKKANKSVIRWQRSFAILVYVFFKHIDEEYKRKRLRRIMLEQGVDEEVVKEIFGVDRVSQWEPFVVTALEYRETTDPMLQTKLSQRLPGSSAEAQKELDEEVQDSRTEA